MKKKVLSIALLVCLITAFIPFESIKTINIMAGTNKKITEYSVGETLEFGLYPQSKVTDETTVVALNELAGVNSSSIASSTSGWTSYGYYPVASTTQSNFMRYKDVTYDGNKYRGVVFDSYRPAFLANRAEVAGESFQKTNGYLINNVYWFKFEPVKWRVLDPKSGYIMSDLILDAQAINFIVSKSDDMYYDKNGNYVNDYANSELRTWLNGTFYNTSFSSAQKKLITKTSLNNEAYGTTDSKYNSASTQDYVFLPSYTDLQQSSYGFTSDSDRRTVGTDYAKCQGIWVGRNSAGKGFTQWFLRNPGETSNNSCSVSTTGNISTGAGYSNYTNRGVRPAIKLSTGSPVTMETSYTVKTYTMNTSGQYELTSTNNYNADMNKDVSATYTISTGFALDSSKSKLSGNTGTIGSLVLEVYISRNTYKLTTVVDGVQKTEEYYYEKEVTKPANPQKTGYTFNCWTVSIPNKMPAYNIVSVAVWDENSNYEIECDTVSETNIIKITGVKWTGKVLEYVSNPQREGYEFICWKYVEDIVTDSTTYSDLVAGDDTVPRIKLTAQWRDVTAPTGEIKLGTNIWKTFLDDITLGVFFNDMQEIEISATDNSGEDVTIEYLMSNEKIAAEDLATKTFNAYNGQFNIEPNNKYVIYAKLTDKAGNVAYISSNGIVMDDVAPVISGIANGEIYCEAQIVTVTEEYVDTVMVNGNPVTLDVNGSFIVYPNDDEQRIVVTDKAGNKSEITITVNDGHTYDWQNENDRYWQKCRYCDDITDKKAIPEITIVGADKVCVTQDYKFSFTLPEGVTEPKAAYYPGDNDCPLSLTEIDGVYNAEVLHSEYAFNSTVTNFNIKVYAKTADGFEFCVTKEILFQSEHSGGTSTCKDKAVCETCGEAYGELDATNHTSTKEWYVRNATQHEQKWNCCGAIVVELENHEWKDGICEECGYVCSHTGGTASCNNKAKCKNCGKEYGEIKSDNHTSLKHIEAKAATTKAEGNIEYWHCEGCNKYFSDKDGKNQIELSDTVIAKLMKPDNNYKSPQTGDGKRMALWFAIAILSSSGLLGTIVFKRKETEN